MPLKVRFSSRDGTRPRGFLFVPDGWRPYGLRPAVILCHGLDSRKENHLDFAELLHARGLAFLVCDFRGHGQSGGSLDAGVLEGVPAAVDFLKRRREIDLNRLKNIVLLDGGDHSSAQHDPALQALTIDWFGNHLS
ncbi:MAG: alpha/beta hydrolase [Chloroflexi bacterium]|nr:alpha/beta hydrolase [Chloroflexota bacterium]